MGEENPARELADREASIDVRGQRRGRRDRRDIVQPEQRRPQVQRRHVPDIEQEDQRETADEVVEGERAAAAEAVAEPTRADRADHVHRAHDAERGGGLHGREVVLERVRHEVREHHAVARVAAHEERAHQEPEGQRLRGLGDGHAARVLGGGDVGRRLRRPRRAERAESALLGRVAQQPQAERHGEHNQTEAEPEERPAPAEAIRQLRRQRNEDELAGRHAARRDAHGHAAVRVEPPGDDRRARAQRGASRADRHQHARGDEQLPEARDERRRDRADAEQRHRRHDDARGSPAVRQATGERSRRAEQ